MISLIVPFKNARPWLKRCLDSIKGDFEVIFVDDGSTDNGREIVERYDVILLDNERTPGVSGARNTGIDHATGDWVTFLDADDELADGAFEAFSKVTSGNIHQFNHIRRYGFKATRKFDNKAGLYRINDLPEAWWGVWNKLYKREFLEGLRFKEGLQYGEDGLFALTTFAKDHRIRCHEEATVVHHFDNKKSLSHVKTAEDLFTQIHAYEEFLLEQDDPEMRRAVCLTIADLWENPRMLRLMSSTSLVPTPRS